MCAQGKMQTYIEANKIFFFFFFLNLCAAFFPLLFFYLIIPFCMIHADSVHGHFIG